MVILKDIFTILFYVGLWKPATWHGWKSILYTLYTSCIVIMASTFLITEVMDLIFVTSNIVEFTNNIFMMSAVISSFIKTIIIIRHRKVITDIIDMLKIYLSKISENEEIIIIDRYTRLIKFMNRSFLCTALFGVSLMVYVASSENISQHILFYRAWLPYNYSQPMAYWMTTTGQVLTIYILTIIYTVFILLFSGIMFNICAHINIFKYHLQVTFSDKYYHSCNDERRCISKNDNDKKTIHDYVETYISIRRLFNTVKNLFSSIMLYQYSVGSIIFCTSAYNVLQVELFSAHFFSIILYMLNMMTELFIICITCNEITLEFQGVPNALYHSLWYATDNHNRKSIVIMMSYTLKPVYFTCGYVIDLSLDSFTNVLKLSYSIYNVLQNTF
ncbi:odorant receptor 43a-like [Microplitis demolitor]|uniref:odorant receptor 43a-like n=1 Tax=Microplitis demolitor TaxID=69319 RepID=UPI0006D4DABA|nr:odorant receptor 43a-like [Microplitis demolitor]